jgi:hypothetical protein
MPSTPALPFGLVVCAAQALRHFAELPTKANLMSEALTVA